MHLRVPLLRLKNEIIRGWYEVPYLYFTLGLVAISGSVMGYRFLFTNRNLEDFYSRHKDRYVVLRPDDVRLNKYPKRFITDQDVLEKFTSKPQEQQQQQTKQE